MIDYYEEIKQSGFLDKTELVILKVLYIYNYDALAHSYRVYKYVSNYINQTNIPEDKKIIACKCALFHDIGKAFGDNLNQTPTRFENCSIREIFHFHCNYGYLILSDYDKFMANVCLLHHDDEEKIKKYFSEEEDVLIVNFIKYWDIFDALTSKRSYKRAYKKKNAYKILSKYPEFSDFLKFLDWSDNNEQN